MRWTSIGKQRSLSAFVISRNFLAKFQPGIRLVQALTCCFICGLISDEKHSWTSNYLNFLMFFSLLFAILTSDPYVHRIIKENPREPVCL